MDRLASDSGRCGVHRDDNPLLDKGDAGQVAPQLVISRRLDLQRTVPPTADERLLDDFSRSYRCEPRECNLTGLRQRNVHWTTRLPGDSTSIGYAVRWNFGSLCCKACKNVVMRSPRRGLVIRQLNELFIRFIWSFRTGSCALRASSCAFAADSFTLVERESPRAAKKSRAQVATSGSSAILNKLRSSAGCSVPMHRTPSP